MYTNGGKQLLSGCNCCNKSKSSSSSNSNDSLRNHSTKASNLSTFNLLSNPFQIKHNSLQVITYSVSFSLCHSCCDSRFFTVTNLAIFISLQFLFLQFLALVSNTYVWFFIFWGWLCVSLSSITWALLSSVWACWSLLAVTCSWSSVLVLWSCLVSCWFAVLLGTTVRGLLLAVGLWSGRHLTLLLVAIAIAWRWLVLSEGALSC